MSCLIIVSSRLQVAGSLRIQERQGRERSGQTNLSSLLLFLGPFLAPLVRPNRLQRPTSLKPTMQSKLDSQLPH